MKYTLNMLGNRVGLLAPNTKRYLFLISLAITALISAPTSAINEPGFGGGTTTDSPPIPIIEWEKRQNIDERLEAYGTNLLGDGIDPHTGALSFSHTDISLPGNSQLEVAIRRNLSQGEYYRKNEALEFGDWQIQVPRIQAIHAVGKFAGNRCSNSLNTSFPMVSASGTNVVHFEYSEGVMMESPGYGAIQLLEKETGGHWPNNARFTTTEGWWFECITAASGGGQGFRGHAPNGDKYTFNKVFIRDASPTGFSSPGTMSRKRTLIVATQVKDIHGNFVNYTYDTSGRLTAISANDGRQITLSYSGSSKLIRSVTANGRTWTYQYSNSTFNNPSYIGTYQAAPRVTLDYVTRPDGTRWRFNLDAMEARPGPGRNCIQVAQTVSLTHPNGVNGVFSLRETNHRQSYNASGRMKGSCPQTPGEIVGGDGTPDSVAFFQSMAVRTKTLSGPLMPDYTWSFSYESDVHSQPGTVRNLCADNSTNSVSECTNWTRVQEPDGRHITYFHLWNGERFGGKLVRKEIRQGNNSGTLLETTDNDYVLETSTFGWSFASSGPAPKTILQPSRKKSTTIKMLGDEYTTTYTYNLDSNSPSYSHGFATSISMASNVQSGTRVKAYTYEHNTAAWKIGLVRTERFNGLLVNEYTYDTKGRKLAHKRFRKDYGEYTYHSSGSQAGQIYTYTDAINRRTTLTNYKRGKPQNIVRPDNELITRSVDNNGWLISQTDARGNTHQYDYDPMGRLALIAPPGLLASTTITYSNLGNGIVQTATMGATRTTIQYDGMQRAILVTKEALSGGGGNIYTGYAYNANNQPIFTSFPSTTVPIMTGDEREGVATTYDALYRQTSTQQTVSPYAQTLTAYAADNKTVTTDAENNVSTATRSGYGGPDDGNIVRLEYPENVTTVMSYDIYGNIKTVSQGNVTQRWSYDSKLRVCAHSTPETGNTRYAYNDADEMVAYAEGQPAGCGTLSTVDKNIITYDALGRQSFLDYSGSTPDIDTSYDSNGNITSKVRGGSSWSYQYDENNLLVSETLNIDDKTYHASYSFDSNGYLTRYRAPSGRVSEYTNDGLGRATSVRDNGVLRAHSALYHPNNVLASLTFNNNLKLTTWLNDNQLIQRSRVKPTTSSSVITDFTYTYDRNANITQIRDAVVPSETRNMTYDGLNRLATASGPWGAGSYSFDTLGNLKKKTLGNRSVTLSYQASTNRLVQSVDVENANTALSYTYDNRGNVTNNGRQSFVYDYANQPITATNNGVYATFVYDGNLKRVKQTINNETIYTVYSQTGNILLRDNATTNERTDYIRIGTLTVAELKNDAVEYVFSDSLGTPTVGTNQSGKVLWRESRTPFGEKFIGSTQRDDEVGYTGHIDDTKLKLTYMQARYYDPVIGRFYSNDPVDVLGHMGSGNLIHGFNRFAYGNNNPYKFTDPTGMSPEDMFKPLRDLFSSPQKQSTQLKQDAGALAKRAGEGAVDGAKIAGNATKESLGTASTVAGLVPGGQGVSIALAVADAALNDTMTSTTSATMSTLTDVAATDLATDSGKVKPTNKVTATIYAVSQIVGIVGGEVQAGNEAQNNKVDKDDE